MTAPAWAAWTPRDGETVHLSRDNRWQLPPGRYTLKACGLDAWDLSGVTVPTGHATSTENLCWEEGRGLLTPISEAELARERQELRLRADAPLRQARFAPMARQHDASDLALFRAVSEPGLAL